MKFVKDKKGANAVVATIVLVAVVLIIGVLLYLWLGGTEDVEVEGKSEAVLAGRLKCDDDVSMRVTCAGGSLNVQNTGSESITAFRIKSGLGVRTMENEVLPGTSKTISSESGSVEVMPVIIQQGVPITCSQQGKTINC